MPIENFSGKAISDTYQRVVQTDGTYLADGTGSILTLLNITSSYTLNSSGSDNSKNGFPYTGSAIITGSLEVIGPFTASSAIISGNVQVLGTASINTLVVNQTQLSTGSNQLGDAASDTQTLYGSVIIPTGSLTVTGSTILSGSSALNVSGDTNLFGDVYASGLFPLSGNRIVYVDGDNGRLSQAEIPGSSGQVFFNNSSNLGAASNLYWDNNNQRLGIRNSNPSFNLDVSGSGRFTSGLLVTGSITSSQNIVVNNINIGRGGTSGSAFQDYNIAIGNSNFSSSVPDRRNIAIGSTALRNLTTGYDNVAIGPAALPANTAGESNVAIGIDTLAKNTLGSYNLAISQQALFNNTFGGYNIGIGWRALYENITGQFNIGLGTFSLYGNKFGSYNIGIGDNTFASLNLSTGSYNTALGYEAASFLRSGSYNLYLGAENDPILSGSSNTFIGSRISASVAGTNLLNNSVIIADGSGSVRFYSPSSSNVLIGTFTDTGQKLQVSGSARITNGLLVTGSITGSGNILANGIVFGSSNNGTLSNVYAGLFGFGSNTTGVRNVGIGYNILPSNTTGDDNIAIGTEALRDNSVGKENIAIGYSALQNNRSGSNNTAIGEATLISHQVGNFNVGVGDVALGDLNSTGSYNTGLGYYAGRSFQSGSYNTFLGVETRLFNSGSNNVIIGGRYTLNQLGAGISDSIVIGTNSGSVRFYSPSSTNVIIGGTTDLGYKLQVSGSANIGNGLTVTGSSIISGSGYTLTVINQTSVGSTTDFIVSGEDSFNRGALGTGVSIFPQGTGQRNLRLLTPTNGSDGTISIGYFKSNWYRAFSISNSPASPHAMIQPDTGNTVIGTSTDISAKLGIRGAGTTSATTALRVENLNASSSLVVLDNGNIGIGIANPSYKLDINGNTRISGDLYMNDATNRTIYGINGTYINLYNGGTGGMDFYSINGTAESRFFGSLRVTGNLITQGGFSMNGNLDIGNNNSVLAVSNGIRIYRGFDASMQFYLGHPSVGDFIWDYPENTTLMVLKRTGNLGIGTSSPSARLQVKGSGTTTSTNALLVQNASNATLLQVNDKGNVGILGPPSGSNTGLTVYSGTNGQSSLTLDANSGSAYYRVNIVAANAFGNSFKIEQEGLEPFLTTTNTGIRLYHTVFQGTDNIGLSTDTGGRYYGIHAPFGSWAAVTRYTNTSTGTGSLDGLMVGLYSGSYGRLWNYETNGTWEIGTGNTQQIQISTSSVSIANHLIVTGSAPSDGTGAVIIRNTTGAGNFRPALQLIQPFQMGWGVVMEIKGNGVDKSGLLFSNDSTSNSWTIGQGVYGSTDNFAIGYRGGSVNSWATPYVVLTTGGNLGIGTSSPGFRLDVSGSSEFVGNVFITGSTFITASASTSSAALYIYKSGSTTVDVQGSSGQLFSITDSLTGSLMSVNDVSGLPILEVSSDDKVVMGTYGAVALTVTGSRVGVYTTTPSASLHVSGAFLGYPVTVPTASGTASLDCSRGNFFNLTLSSSFTLFLSASNIQPGQTINLRVTQPATSGSLAYGSQFKFAGGIPYTASATGSAVDIISFITFDTTNLYGSAIKNLL